MPINEQLYRALRRHYGRVEIANEGQKPDVAYHPSYDHGGRLQVRVSGGEYYKICCPVLR